MFNLGPARGACGIHVRSCSSSGSKLGHEESLKLAKDSITNTLVTVTSGEDLRMKTALGHLSGPAIHKLMAIFKEITLQQTVAQTAANLDLSCLLSGPLLWASEEQLTNGVRPAKRTLRDLPPTSGLSTCANQAGPSTSSLTAEDQR